MTVYKKCSNCEAPTAIILTNNVTSIAVDEDSLSIQDMADAEDKKLVLFDASRHVSHVCKDSGQ